MTHLHPKFHSAVAAAVCSATALSGAALAATGETAIVVSAGGRRFAAIVEDTAIGRAFLGKLPLTLDMSELDAFASGAAEHRPSAAPREKVRRVACRIFVTDNGGHLGALDLEAREAEQYLMLGALHPAPGATNATLDVYGFSEITLDWHALGPGLRITGCGQIANLTPPGRGTRHRWFDYDDPL